LGEIWDREADYDLNLFIATPEHYSQNDGWISSIRSAWLYVPDKVTRYGRHQAP
jgi:hypothetical protein